MTKLWIDADAAPQVVMRNFMDGLRTSGVDTGGHGVYGAREKQAFANALDRALTRALKSR